MGEVGGTPELLDDLGCHLKVLTLLLWPCLDIIISFLRAQGTECCWSRSVHQTAVFHHYHHSDSALSHRDNEFHLGLWHSLPFLCSTFNHLILTALHRSLYVSLVCSLISLLASVPQLITSTPTMKLTVVNSHTFHGFCLNEFRAQVTCTMSLKIYTG